jgi:hypothetical protein
MKLTLITFFVVIFTGVLNVFEPNAEAAAQFDFRSVNRDILLFDSPDLRLHYVKDDLLKEITEKNRFLFVNGTSGEHRVLNETMSLRKFIERERIRVSSTRRVRLVKKDIIVQIESPEDEYSKYLIEPGDIVAHCVRQ